MLIDHSAVSQSLDGINLLSYGASAASVEMNAPQRNTVQMMPQEEVRSENDLGFMTEVDAEYVAKKTFNNAK